MQKKYGHNPGCFRDAYYIEATQYSVWRLGRARLFRPVRQQLRSETKYGFADAKNA